MTDDRTPEPAPAAASGSTSNLMNFARGAKAVALLCFLLPWVTVSCAGQPLIRMTGVGMATGNISPVANPAAGFPGASGNPALNAAQSADPDLLILVAALLIVAGLVATFVMRRGPAALVGMITAVASAVLIGFEVLVRIKGQAEAQLRQGMSTSGPAPTNEFEKAAQQQAEQMAQAISVDPQIGFWLTLIALIAAAVLFKMVHGRRDTA